MTLFWIIFAATLLGILARVPKRVLGTLVILFAIMLAVAGVHQPGFGH